MRRVRSLDDNSEASIVKFWAHVQRLSAQLVTQGVSAWRAGYVITYAALHEI